MTNLALLIPPELLSVIFDECVSIAHEPDWCPWQEHCCTANCLRGWIHVTHVCQYWRAVALAHSALWTRPVPASWVGIKGMLERSNGVPLTISTLSIHPPDTLRSQRRSIYLPHDVLKRTAMQRIEQVKEFVLDGSIREVLEFIAEIGRPRDRPGDNPLALESFSLRRHGNIDGAQFPLPTHVKFLHASKLKRLHIYDPPILSIRPTTLDGMPNLRELSLSFAIRPLGGLEGHQIHLPRLACLNLVDPVDLCHQFLAAIRPSPRLHYVGIEATHDSYDDTPGLLPSLRNALETYHVLGASSTPDGPLDLSEYQCALAFRTYGCSEGKSSFWLGGVHSNAAHNSSPALSLLRKRITWSSTKRVTSRAVLDYPGIFARGHRYISLHQLHLEVLSLFSPRYVVSLDIVAEDRDSILAPALATMLEATSHIRYLRLTRLRVEHVVEVLTPLSAYGSHTVLLPNLKDLTLDCIELLPDDQYGKPSESTVYTSLATCLSARSRHGASLDRLELQRHSFLRDEERSALEDLGVHLIS